MLLPMVMLVYLVGSTVPLGLTKNAFVDSVPDHTTVGGFGGFVHGRNVKDVVPGPGSDAVVYDVVPGPNAISPSNRFNALVRDIVPDAGSNIVVHDVVFDPTSNAGDSDIIQHVESNNFVPDVVPVSGVAVPDIIASAKYVVESNVVHGSSSIVYDVVPGSSSIVHDIVPGSSSIVHDIVPGSSFIVHDIVPGSSSIVHDVVPRSSSIVHDIVPGASSLIHDTVQASRFSTYVRDVVPSSNAIVHDVVGGLPTSGMFLSKKTGIRPFSGIGSLLPRLSSSHHSSAMPSSRVDQSAAAPHIDPEVLKCGLQPELYVVYQLSRLSYNYPKKEIVQEMEQRPSVRAAIFSLDSKGIGSKYHLTPSINIHGKRLRRQAVPSGGCKTDVLTLRQFYAYNNHCWVLNPVYQQIHYHHCGRSCGSPGSGYGRLNRCEATYQPTAIWAYCAGLRYGGRITKISVPLPTGCSCRTYNCS